MFLSSLLLSPFYVSCHCISLSLHILTVAVCCRLPFTALQEEVPVLAGGSAQTEAGPEREGRERSQGGGGGGEEEGAGAGGGDEEATGHGAGEQE